MTHNEQVIAAYEKWRDEDYWELMSPEKMAWEAYRKGVEYGQRRPDHIGHAWLMARIEQLGATDLAIKGVEPVLPLLAADVRIYPTPGGGLLLASDQRHRRLEILPNGKSVVVWV